MAGELVGWDFLGEPDALHGQVKPRARDKVQAAHFGE